MAPDNRQSPAVLILLHMNQESDCVYKRFAQDRWRQLTAYGRTDGNAKSGRMVGVSDAVSYGAQQGDATSFRHVGATREYLAITHLIAGGCTLDTGPGRKS